MQDCDSWERNRQCEPGVHLGCVSGGTSQIAEKGGETQAKHRNRESGISEKWGVWNLRVRVSGRRKLPGEKNSKIYIKVPLSIVLKSNLQMWRVSLHEAGQKNNQGTVSWSVPRTRVGLGDVWVVVNCSEEFVLGPWGRWRITPSETERTSSRAKDTQNLP